MPAVARALALGLLAGSTACNSVLGIEEAKVDPTFVVGSSCTDTSQCSAIPEGYCADAKVCTRTCTLQEDCGCAPGTTIADIAAGNCGANCTSYSSGTAYCFRSCTTDADCDRATFCEQGTDYKYCEPARTAVGTTCGADRACSGISGGTCTLVSRLCTKACTSHTDCGCPAGTTDSTVLTSNCAACAPEPGSGTRQCQRACSTDADCYGHSYCVMLSSYGVCYRDDAIGSPCFADYQCNAQPSDRCGADGLCTRTCSTHQDCGCPAGTSDPRGVCSYACDGGSCRRLCNSLADCHGSTTTCSLATSYTVCQGGG